MARSSVTASRTTVPTSTAEGTSRCCQRSHISPRRTNTEGCAEVLRCVPRRSTSHLEELAEDATRAGTVDHQTDVMAMAPAPGEVRPARGDRGRGVLGPGYFVLVTCCGNAPIGIPLSLRTHSARRGEAGAAG